MHCIYSVCMKMYNVYTHVHVQYIMYVQCTCTCIIIMDMYYAGGCCVFSSLSQMERYLPLQVDQDTYWNEQHTSNAAKMAVGSVIELADKVVSGEVKVRCFHKHVIFSLHPSISPSSRPPSLSHSHSLSLPPLSLSLSPSLPPPPPLTLSLEWVCVCPSSWPSRPSQSSNVSHTPLLSHCCSVYVHACINIIIHTYIHVFT